MPSGKFAPGAGLEICFEGCGFFAVLESYRSFYVPGAELGGVRDASFVVFLQAGVEVGGEAGVVGRRIAFGCKDVDVMEVIHGVFGLPSRLVTP